MDVRVRTRTFMYVHICDCVHHSVTTSSLTMEVEAVSHAIQWLASQSA